MKCRLLFKAATTKCSHTSALHRGGHEFDSHVAD